MSYDLAFWWEPTQISSEEAARKFAGLDEELEGVVAEHSSVHTFYQAVLDEFGDLTPETMETSPWSAPVYRSDACVMISASPSRASEVAPRILDLARRHGLTVFDPQSGDVYPASPGGDSEEWPRLELASGEVRLHPSAEQITDALSEMSAEDWYVILELEPDVFIQVGIGSEAGVPVGAYAVEFRGGEPESHLGTVTRDFADVESAFLDFLRGKTEWRRRFDWSPVVY